MFGYLALGLVAYMFDFKRIMYSSLLGCAVIAFHNHEIAGAGGADRTPCQSLQHRCDSFGSQDLTADFDLPQHEYSEAD